MTSVALRVLCFTSRPELATLARESLAMHLGSVELDTSSSSSVPRERAVACAIVDERVAGRRGVEIVRELRAGGFGGGVVLIASPGASTSSATAASAGRLGAVLVADDARLATALPAAAVESMGASGAVESSTAQAALRRTEQLVAAGEIALGLQHALNNALAALLAEAQLLEMEKLPAEPGASVRRMVELCRRLADIVRQLDVVRAPGLRR